MIENASLQRIWHYFILAGKYSKNEAVWGFGSITYYLSSIFTDELTICRIPVWTIYSQLNGLLNAAKGILLLNIVSSRGKQIALFGNDNVTTMQPCLSTLGQQPRDCCSMSWWMHTWFVLGTGSFKRSSWALHLILVNEYYEQPDERISSIENEPETSSQPCLTWNTLFTRQL